MRFLIRRIRRKASLKLNDSDDVPPTSPTLTTSEMTDRNSQTIGDDWANFTEPAMEPAKEAPWAFQTEATREVLQDLENFQVNRPPRPSSASDANKAGGREPVWKRRFRTHKASIDQETHPFDEGHNPLLRKKAVHRIIIKNSEGETSPSVYSAPFTQSEELDRFLPIKRARSDHYVDLDKKSLGRCFGDMRTHSMRRDASQHSDPFRSIEDPDGFSLETPSSVGISSLEHSYSTRSITDLEDESIASSYSSLSQKRSKSGFGVGKFIDAIGGLRVTKTSTFADEVKNFADLVADQAACSQCLPTTRAH